MTRRELFRQVARATGESARTIARRGFSLVEDVADMTEYEPDRPPLVVDWDLVQGHCGSLAKRAA